MRIKRAQVSTHPKKIEIRDESTVPQLFVKSFKIDSYSNESVSLESKMSFTRLQWAIK